jgi:hypothetical protein
MVRVELGAVSDMGREERKYISDLKKEKKEARDREKDYVNKVKPAEIMTAGLRERIMMLERELGRLREENEVLGKRDVEVELVRQEREAFRLDKGNLIRERDDAREGKASAVDEN